MPNYIIAYHGKMKKPKSPEEGTVQMAKWKAWLGGLGDAVVNPGSPMGASKIVGSTGVSEDDWPNAMFGFSIVNSDSFDSALDMAKACPVLEYGGTLRVSELMEIKM